ncbi:thiamine-binding protein [Paenibacillus sp. GXUN7292]|uniref:thiamine-binding protein n=1 Tax=Paenibacillus sp. GXUN7292 TaxID=3422499 RepID=UPI003D7DFA26
MPNAVMSFEAIARTEDSAPFMDRAVEILRESGVKFIVGPLDTLMEGELGELLEVVKRVNEELSAIGGNTSISSLIKIHFDPQGISIDQLTEGYQ